MRVGFIRDSLTQGVLGCAYMTRLRRALPERILVNLGVGGDTVSSLLRRIRHLPERERFDLAFLWVGVNDTISAGESLFRITASLAPQRPAADMNTFLGHYVEALEIVLALAPRVVAVSPLFKGENADGALNHRLRMMAEVISEEVAERENVDYLDLCSEMMARLADACGPGFRSMPLRAIGDVLFARSDASIDRRAVRRGYTYSLDGLHLNSLGADYVAKRFLREIRRQLG